MKAEAVLGLWQDRPAPEALITASAAESLGYRRLWIGEMATYDSFALATAIAGSTQTIELIVGPLAVAVRTPLNIAMGVASVASLTGRTTHVALGTSSSVVVERWHGRSRSRGTRAVGATAQSVRALLVGDRDPASGFRLRLDHGDAQLNIAAFGPRAVAVAAVHADRMLLNMVTPDAVAAFRRQLDLAGGQEVPMVAWLVAAVDPIPDEDIAQIRSAVVGYLAAPGYGEMFVQAGYPELVDLARSGAHPREILSAMPEGFERSVGLVGSRSEIAALIESYAEAGLDTVGVVPVTASGDYGKKALEAIADVSESTAND
jgi:probable F420-dependent oxidoreductase